MRSKEVEYKIKELKRKREYAFRCEYDFATVMLEEIDTALNYIEELEKHTEQLEEDNIEWRTKWLKLLGEIDVIPKQVIRDKIKELEAMAISQDIYYDDILKMFKDLLEGE